MHFQAKNAFFGCVFDRKKVFVAKVWECYESNIWMLRSQGENGICRSPQALSNELIAAIGLDAAENGQFKALG